MHSRKRPLSPHLQVYRPMYTMVLSILHRLSGVVLSACSLLLAHWLFSAARGPDAYANAMRLFANPLVQLVVAGGLVAFWFHLFAGLRHLAWDAGYGFEKSEARASGWIVVLLTAMAAAFTLALAWRHFGAGA